jgi:hypothetical protein
MGDRAIPVCCSDIQVSRSESPLQLLIILDRANHPDAKVLCSDANDILKYIVDRQEGNGATPPQSSNDPILPDDVPRPGEVDFVGGGEHLFLDFQVFPYFT